MSRTSSPRSAGGGDSVNHALEPGWEHTMCSRRLNDRNGLVRVGDGELSVPARLKVTPRDSLCCQAGHGQPGHAQGFVICTSRPKACLLCRCRGKQERAGGWHGSDPPVQGTGASSSCPCDRGDAKEPRAARAAGMAPGMSLRTQSPPAVPNLLPSSDTHRVLTAEMMFNGVGR